MRYHLICESNKLFVSIRSLHQETIWRILEWETIKFLANLTQNKIFWPKASCWVPLPLVQLHICLSGRNCGSSCWICWWKKACQGWLQSMVIQNFNVKVVSFQGLISAPGAGIYNGCLRKNTTNLGQGAFCLLRIKWKDNIAHLPEAVFPGVDLKLYWGCRRSS